MGIINIIFGGVFLILALIAFVADSNSIQFWGALIISQTWIVAGLNRRDGND
jgi:hypothetical protein